MYLLRLPPAGARKHRGDIYQLTCGLWGKYHKETYLLHCTTDALNKTHTYVHTHTQCNSPIRVCVPLPLVKSSKEARKERVQEAGNGGEEGSRESTKIIFVQKTP